MSSEVCCNIRKLGFTTPNLEARRTATSSGTCPFYQGRAFYDCDYLAHQIPSASADNHQQKPFRGNDNDNFLAPSSFDAGITVYQSDEYPLSLMQPSQCADDSLSSHSSSSDNDIRASPPGYGGYCGSFGVPMSLRSDALERPMYNCIDTGEYSDTATSPYKTPALRPVMESFLGSCENNRRSRVNYKWTYRNGQCCYQTESEAEADSVHGQLCHYRTKATMAHTPLEHHIDELLISIDDELIVHFTRAAKR
ncbi:hypothetical protein BX666DRAFT_2031949 [Dichotomocladium elegans]|nr:hypothetical protein BX666DRAFT_2031949 [Dichotomocladium elegans]